MKIEATLLHGAFVDLADFYAARSINVVGLIADA